jgi:hypothetical protein
MTSKVSRNDICSCGSGKKFKKCCLLKASDNNVQEVDFGWSGIRKTEGSVVDNHLMPYINEELPQGVLQLALEDFLPKDLPEEVDRELLFLNFFVPWVLFNWIPFDNFDLNYFESEETIATNYIKRHKNRLNKAESRFIIAINKTYYSFYSVQAVDFEKSLTLKDLLLGTTHTVKEKQGTHKLKRGDIVFSRILTLDDQSIFIGMAPYIVPVDFQHDIINFKKWMIEENDREALSEETLREEFDIDLLNYFFELIERGYNRPPPILTNTDGEPFQLTVTHFELRISPEETIHRLFSLMLLKNPEEILDHAERTKAGKIKSVEFPWLKKGNKKNKTWDNTVMGHIVIKGKKLTLEVNSEKRLKKGNKLLAKLLDEDIHFVKKTIGAPALKTNALLQKKEKSKIDEDFLKTEEMQAEIKRMAQEHWESWFDTAIPALDNKTPRQAAKTTDGQEQLEALLMLYERHNSERDKNDLFKADINYLRRKLGLD